MSFLRNAPARLFRIAASFMTLAMFAGLTTVGHADPTAAASKWPHDYFALTDVQSNTLDLQSDGALDKAAPPFVASDYAPYAGTGSGIVHGYVAILTQRGDVRCTTWDEPLLVPYTPYTYWLAKKMMAVGVATGNPNTEKLFLDALPHWMQPDLGAENTGILRRTGCNPKSGYFRFDGLADGNYFVLASLHVPVNTVRHLDDMKGSEKTDFAGDTEILITHHYFDMPWSTLADGFLLLQLGHSEVRSDRRVAGMIPDDFGVGAHLHAAQNYGKIPELPPL